MKKIRVLLLAIVIIPSLLSHAQVQRLVSLPFHMGGEGGELLSLCIDLFRNGPTDHNYGIIGEAGFKPKYNSKDLSRVNVGQSIDQFSDIQFLGTSNEVVPKHYQEFIRSTIKKYDNRKLTYGEQEALQDEIWAYNGMDKLGLINRYMPARVTEFKRAKKAFQFKYDLTKGGEFEHFDIWSKAYELHSLKVKNANKVLASVKTRFSETGIACNVSNTRHVIEVNFDGVSFAEVSGLSSQIDNAVKTYRASYYRLPDRADFANYPQQTGKYLLSFSSDSWPSYNMNFLIANDVTGKKITIIFLQDYCLVK